jgi:hypothetical protein
MKKTIFILFLVCLTFNGYSQKGYIITQSDSLKIGFLKYQRNDKSQLEIELWETKRDKNPKKYLLSELNEYAIKKDTFRVFTNVYPYKGESLFFDILELRIIKKGKLNLYSGFEIDGGIGNDLFIAGTRNTAEAQMALNPSFNLRGFTISKRIFVIEDNTGNIQVINRKDFIDDLSMFLNYDKYSAKLPNQKLLYDDIPKLIELYNRSK